MTVHFTFLNFSHLKDRHREDTTINVLNKNGSNVFFRMHYDRQIFNFCYFLMHKIHNNILPIDIKIIHLSCQSFVIIPLPSTHAENSSLLVKRKSNKSTFIIVMLYKKVKSPVKINKKSKYLMLSTLTRYSNSLYTDAYIKKSSFDYN